MMIIQIEKLTCCLFRFSPLFVFRDEPLLLGQQQLSLWQQRPGFGHGAGISMGSAPAHKLGQCGQASSRIHSQGGNWNAGKLWTLPSTNPFICPVQSICHLMVTNIRPDLLITNNTVALMGSYSVPGDLMSWRARGLFLMWTTNVTPWQKEAPPPQMACPHCWTLGKW